jgi:hypothetical protein
MRSQAYFPLKRQPQALQCEAHPLDERLAFHVLFPIADFHQLYNPTTAHPLSAAAAPAFSGP